MKKILFSGLLALGLIGCGGGSGGSSNNASEINVETTNPLEIEANIIREIQKANEFQKNTIHNYEYYGYQIFKKGYSVEKDGALHSCTTGTIFVAAQNRGNSLLFVQVYNDNDVSTGEVPKIGNVYTKTNEDNEDKYTGTLKFIDNGKYIVGTIIGYNKTINKYCNSEVYMKSK